MGMILSKVAYFQRTAAPFHDCSGSLLDCHFANLATLPL